LGIGPSQGTSSAFRFAAYDQQGGLVALRDVISENPLEPFLVMNGADPWLVLREPGVDGGMDLVLEPF
jgi:hypothetical protein